jgi:hypothetical protein
VSTLVYSVAGAKRKQIVARIEAGFRDVCGDIVGELLILGVYVRIRVDRPV